jgi:hypothetical protein
MEHRCFWINCLTGYASSIKKPRLNKVKQSCHVLPLGAEGLALHASISAFLTAEVLAVRNFYMAGIAVGHHLSTYISKKSHSTS